MPSISDLPARGKVIRKNQRRIVFHPIATAYQLHLDAPAGFDAPLDRPIDAVIRVRARKLWTVPSGGLFIEPIFGTPRTIQGRVRYLDERQMVLNAGTNVLVELPNADSAYDLSNGGIVVGKLVNVAALPGATIEPVMVRGEV